MYPFLAYYLYEQGKDKICISNVQQASPIRILDLDQFHFVHFVDQSPGIAKDEFEYSECSTSIMFLVQCHGTYRLMSFVDKPYAKLNEQRPEFHLLSGTIDFAAALTSDQEKNEAENEIRKTKMTLRPD